MAILHNSKERGEAEGRAPLALQIRRCVLSVIVAVSVLAAMHIDHRGLNVNMPQLVFDGEQVGVAVYHVGGQRMPQQVRPHAAVNTGTLRQHVDVPVYATVADLIDALVRAKNGILDRAIKQYAPPAVKASQAQADATAEKLRKDQDAALARPEKK